MPGQTAAELGLTNAELYKLEEAGKATRVGLRRGLGRGRPPVEWEVLDGANITPTRRGGGLAAAREQRSKAAADKVWEVVSKNITEQGCRCGLKRGMTWEDLRPLGAGCTSPVDYERKVLGKPAPVFETEEERRLHNLKLLNSQQGYVCPVLDQYRRLVGGPPTRGEQDAQASG